jgi:nitronate monooxygenase
MPVNRLCSLLGIQYPLIQAPMAGGPTTPALVAAVSEAGALGSVGAAYLSPEQILEVGREIRSRTDRPFGVNLFAPVPSGPSVDPGPMLELLEPIHAELKLPPPEAPRPSPDPFDAQLGAVLESGAAVFSVTFGLPSAEQVRLLKQRGLVCLGTATTVEEARRIEATGFDAVVAQGSEAGGHRGTFLGSFDRGMVGTMALVPQIVDAVRIPVIAAGGIMDGRGWVAAEALGASGVQLGTAFLGADESGASEAFKDALAEATDDGTAITRVFSGRPARGLVNAFLRAAEERAGDILPYPLQNSLTRPMRTAAARAGRPEFLSMWAGQGARLARREPAAAIVKRLVGDAERVRARLRPG